MRDQTRGHQRTSEKAVPGLAQAAAAAFFFLYFTKICPLVVFDSDDWIFLGSWRVPLPIWGGWNPTRVTPETLLPVSGWIAAHIFYPLCGDFVEAVTLSGGILVTFFVVLLGWSAFLFARKRLELSAAGAAAFEALFLILQFLIFRNRAGSRNLFTAADYSCVFFYTVSGMVNGAAVLIMMSAEHFEQEFRQYAVWKRTLFLLLLYAALFSNLFHSAILTVYCGLHLLLELVCWLRRRRSAEKMAESEPSTFGNLARDNRIHLMILLVWLVVLLFEANGGRADSVETGSGLDLPNALRQLKALVGALSKPYLILTILAVVGGVLLCVHGRAKDKTSQNRMGKGTSAATDAAEPAESDSSEQKRRSASEQECRMKRVCLFIVTNAAVLTAYLLILNAEVGYMSRIDATWGIWFWCVLFTDVAVAGLLAGVQGGRKWILPVLAVSAALAILPDGRYMASTADPEGGAHSAAVSRFLCEQVISAAESPEHAGDLIIPDYRGTDLEWAVSEGIGTNISDTLYGLGVIGGIPEFHVVYNPELNS